MARESAPKYRQLFDAFVEAVHEGTFSPGDRLPNEADVADSLPVSLGTVQKALNQLSDTGLIVRNKRSGTFVRDWQTRAEDAFIYRFSDPNTGRQLPPSTRALKVCEDNSEGPWRTLFGDRALICLERLVWVENEAPAYSRVFLPRAFSVHLLQVPIDQLHGISYHRMLAETAAPPPMHMRERISCAPISPAALRHLALSAPTHGIIWEVEEFSFNNEPLVFQQIQLPPGHRPLEMTRNVQSN